MYKTRLRDKTNFYIKDFKNSIYDILIQKFTKSFQHKF